MKNWLSYSYNHLYHHHHHYNCHHHHQPCLISWVNIAESQGLTLSPMDIFGKIPQKTSSAIFFKRSQWNILILSNLLVGSAKEFAALVSPMMYFFQPGFCSTTLWNILTWKQTTKLLDFLHFNLKNPMVPNMANVLLVWVSETVSRGSY